LLALLKRNTLWNLFGAGAPFLLGIATIPYLIRHIGVERFGVLTIVWALIGYFSLFDFGLGRALTQQVATNRASGRTEELSSLVKTGLSFILATGIFGGLLLALCSNHLGMKWLNVNTLFQVDTVNSLLIASAGIPLTTLSIGFKGILEAYEDFRSVNVLRFFLGIANFGFPVLSVVLFGPSLPIIVASLVTARLLTLVAHLFLVNKKLPSVWMKVCCDRKKMGGLLSFGAWMTVSNVVGPLMVVADRFIISSVLGASLVAYYTVPVDFLVRILIIPGALATALFPRLTSLIFVDVNSARDTYMKSLKVTVFTMLPICFCIVLGSYWGLCFWLGEEFALHSWKVTSILSVGLFFNGLAQIPFAAIHAAGKAKATAVLHLGEFLFYLPLLFISLRYFGLTGAAISWVIRCFVDFIMLLVITNKIMAEESQLVEGAL
jgi:O-antigen/teichoic acid export membrane protein